MLYTVAAIKTFPYLFFLRHSYELDYVRKKNIVSRNLFAVVDFYISFEEFEQKEFVVERLLFHGEEFYFLATNS